MKTKKLFSLFSSLAVCSFICGLAACTCPASAEKVPASKDAVKKAPAKKAACPKKATCPKKAPAKKAPIKKNVIKETPLKVHYAMEKRGDFRATFLRDFKYVKYVDGGVKGKCFQVKVPKDHRYNGFAIHSGARQYTTFPGTIKISAMVKGKGKCSLGFIVYNRKYKIYWITTAPGSSSRREEINSPDKWVKKEFIFKPSMQNVKEITGFLACSGVAPGSELYFDDIRTEIIPHPQKAALARKFPHISEAEAKAKYHKPRKKAPAKTKAK